MSDPIHLIIEKGAEQGRQLTIPAQGARMGRSSRNDIMLSDPSLSRHHCRLYFKPDEGLWVADLGSANETLVNGKAVAETRVRAGDTIAIGDTLLRVVSDAAGASMPDTPTPTAAVQAPKPASPHAGTSVVPSAAPLDLGFGRETSDAAQTMTMAGKASSAQRTRQPLVFALLAGLVIVLIALTAWVIRKPRAQSAPPQPRPLNAQPAPGESTIAFEATYERVQATASNIFRYHLQIGPDGLVTVQIDDLANNRHVRKEKRMDSDYARTVARALQDSGFLNLRPLYQGIQPEVLDAADIALTIGRRAHRVRVVNRIEPDPFRAVRERLEDLGRKELDLWAIPFSPEKLLELARDAYLTGRKLSDEREVRHDNLFQAIRSFKEADWYLETLDPKPDFHGDMITRLRDAEKDLQQRHDDVNFRAQRAIKLKDWAEAADALRILRDMIPERTDPRHQDAQKNLVDVENRLNLKK